MIEIKIKYEGINYKGEKVSGVEIGKNLKEIKIRLKEQGIIPIKLRRSINFTINTLNFKEKLLENLEMLLNGGISLRNSLDLMIHFEQNKKTQEIIKNIRDSMDNGDELHRSLEKFYIISEEYGEILKVGELTGNIDESLKKIVDINKKKKIQRNIIITMMAYPLIVVVVFIIFMIGANIYILPMILEMFHGNEEKLPIITQLILYMLKKIKLYLFIFIILCILLSYYSKDILDKTQIHFKLPFVKNILRINMTINFIRLLKVLLEGGVILSEALWLSKSALIEKRVYEKFIISHKKIIEGKGLGKSLEDLKIFNWEEIALIKIGEETGEIIKSFEKIYLSKEQKLKETLNVFFKLGEPILILVIGSILGIVIYALYLPIFSLEILL